ncbi:MAG: hypothetical protein ABW318_21320 [Vicinamibacterales bacterium]|jgi:hypothetical protein
MKLTLLHECQEALQHIQYVTERAVGANLSHRTLAALNRATAGIEEVMTAIDNDKEIWRPANDAGPR